MTNGAAAERQPCPLLRRCAGVRGLTKMKRSERRKGQRGQTLLEFALVAPLLLVFVLGLVDFGIAIDRRLVLDHAVREGARYASVGATDITGNRTVADVKTYTAAQSQGVVDSAAVVVCRNAAAGSVDVRVNYTHSFVTGFTSIFGSGGPGIVMNPRATARIEHSLSGAVPSC